MSGPVPPAAAGGPLVRSLGRLAAKARAGSPRHPTVKELAAYYDDELPPQREAEVQEHLAVCRECAPLVLALDDLCHPAPAGRTTDVETTAAWRRFVARLAAERRSAARLRIGGWLAAACLLLATAALSVHVRSQHREMQRATVPRAVVETVDIDLGITRSAEVPKDRIPLCEHGPTLVRLLLDPPGRPAAVVFLDADGREAARVEDLTVRDGGRTSAFKLERSRDLRPGEYVLRVVTGGRAEPVERRVELVVP